MLIYSRFLGDVILHDGRRIAYAKMTDGQQSAMHDAIRRAEADWIKFRDDETNWGGEPPASWETKSPRLDPIHGVAPACHPHPRTGWTLPFREWHSRGEPP